ncbi:MAG: hypothetical protein AAGJ93_08710 [Bacteroidota bacterium]
MRVMDVIRLCLLAGVVSLSLLMLLSILPMLRFFLLIILTVLFIAVLLYYYRQTQQEKQSEKAFLKTTAGQITTHLKECEAQKKKLEEEQNSIQKSLIDLTQQLQHTASLPASVAGKTQELIKGFEKEKKLRQTKIQFFEQCTAKLEALLAQHQLLQTLAEKKAELDRYQDQHYDDLAKMESLRWEVEQETVKLESLQNLSTRMQNSSAIDDVLHLQQELDKMLAS